MSTVRSRKHSEVHVKDELRRRLLEAGDCPLDSRAKTIYYLKYCQRHGYPWKDLYVRDKVVQKKLREIEEVSEEDYQNWIQAEDQRFSSRYRTKFYNNNRPLFQARLSTTAPLKIPPLNRAISPRMHPYPYNDSMGQYSVSTLHGGALTDRQERPVVHDILPKPPMNNNSFLKIDPEIARGVPGFQLNCYQGDLVQSNTIVDTKSDSKDKILCFDKFLFPRNFLPSSENDSPWLYRQKFEQIEPVLVHKNPEKSNISLPSIEHLLSKALEFEHKNSQRPNRPSSHSS